MVPNDYASPAWQERTVGLVQAYRAGDERALEVLIGMYLPFIRSVVKSLCGAAFFEDALQEALIVFCRLVANYDVRRRTVFASYCKTYLRSAVIDWLHNHGAVVRVPRCVYTQAKRVQRVREEFQRRHGRPPSSRELSELTGLSDRSLALRQYAYQARSVVHLGDSWLQLPEERYEEPDGELPAELQQLWEIFQRLDELEQRVLWLRYHDEFSVAETSQCLGMSEKEVRGICRRALRKCMTWLRQSEYDLSEVAFAKELQVLQKRVS